MAWLARLELDYRRDGDRTIAFDRHQGPLRVLQRLYPEGDAVCHHVLVHPPGGIVGGDVLQVQAHLAAGSHALITTPGATRFYRSAGERSLQQVQARLEPGARLEWLPMETIAYRGCRVDNRLAFDLAPGAQMIGWDILALGLPAAGQAFEAGDIQQDLQVRGQWLERGRIDGQDRLLLDSPLGLAGHGLLATLWLADGLPEPSAEGARLAADPIDRVRREALLDAARARIATSPLAPQAGATALGGGLVVLRALADRVEPAMALLQAVWADWRQLHWGLAACAPRVWRT